MFDHLYAILKRHADADANVWLDEFLAQQRQSFSERPFYYAFSGATRRFAKSALELTKSEAAQLGESSPEFSVAGWTQDRLARVLLLLVLAEQDEPVFLKSLNALIETADIREQIAIFSAFPLLPCPAELVPLAREGLRTNVVDIFDSIALENPFPAAQFDEEGWNQMVLKCFFINRPVYRVLGIERRANQALAKAISDLAHERWAAGRQISPEAWHSCQDFLTPEIVEDLGRVADSEEPGDREAVALIFAHEGGKALSGLEGKVADLLPKVASGEVSWASVGESVNGKQ